MFTPFTISVVLFENRFDNAFTSSEFRPNTAESDACNDPLTAIYANVPSVCSGTATVTTFGGDSMFPKDLSAIYYLIAKNCGSAKMLPSLASLFTLEFGPKCFQILLMPRICI